MPQAEIMPLGEQLKLMIKMHELETQGKMEEAANLKRQVPAPAYLAKFAKDHFGVDFIRNCGWSMAEAEAVYGADWLTK
jgi:hypothetical protein